jgi:hypothetical protein
MLSDDAAFVPRGAKDVGGSDRKQLERVHRGVAELRIETVFHILALVY